MDIKNQAADVIKLLKKEYPEAKTSLGYGTNMQLLAAVILSAQCTDKRVNMVTTHLFKKYKTAADFASANLNTFKQEIRSTGFYRNKAKNIIASAKMIVKDFNGKVPETMENLLKLPGVARKTANVVLGNAYSIVEGIVVDTHCKRVSYRLGLTSSTAPEKSEKELMQIIPRKDWLNYGYLAIAHGRAICKAPVPICSKCVLNKLCPKKGVKKFY